MVRIFQVSLTAADRDDDFKLVAVGQHSLIELSARNDFAVAFQCDAFVTQLHLLQQFGDAERALKSSGGAVDGDGNHFQRYDWLR